jgi:hypothetical protein
VSYFLNIAEGYAQGKIEVIVELCVMGYARKYYLVFRAIPQGGHSQFTNALEISSRNAADDKREHVNNNRFMLVGITKLVENPKGIIPSFVWLVADYEFVELLWQITGSTRISASSANIKMLESSAYVFPKGKVGVAPIHAGSFTDGVTGLVQSVPQMDQNLESNSGQFDWNPLKQFDLEYILSSILVLLYDGAAMLHLRESSDLSFKCLNVRLGTPTTEL